MPTLAFRRPTIEVRRRAAAFGEGVRRCAAAVGLALLLAQGALAQSPAVQFRLEADQTQVASGEPVTVTIVIQNSTRDGQDAAPTLPDFGKLQILSGPLSQMTTQNINGVFSLIRQFQWQVTSATPGEYVIGPSQIAIGGRNYTTKPVKITVTAASAMPSLPDSLRNEKILAARTSDAALNKTLSGRLFLLQQVYNETPYVSQPVLVLYKLYKDPRLNIANLNESMPDITGALSEELFHTQQIDWQRLQVDGKTFDVAKVLSLALTPTKAGELTLNSYQMGGRLIVPRSRRTSPDDPIQQMQDMFGDDPFFGDPFNRGVELQLPCPQIMLKVRPLPDAGKPAGFNGTVGEYTLAETTDRTKATEDELVTLSLTLEGKGAIELAAPPVVQTPDFDQIGTQNKVEKTKSSDGIGGKKTFEFVLRPKHSGILKIPEITYAVFNPRLEQYETLRSKPMQMLVSPGASPRPAATPAPGVASAAPASGIADLHYLRPISELDTTTPQPLMTDPLLWTVEAAGLALWIAAWLRRRAIQRRDPAHARRQGAWRRFEKRLQAIRQQPAIDAQATAGAFEAAARDCIADYFNLSPDGLTRPDIERLLRGSAMPAERVQRICDLLDQCTALSYSPAAAAPEDPLQWGDELGRLLKEGLAS